MRRPQREWWWIPLFYTLVVIWIYRDLWHQHGVATGLGWDAIDSYGPDLDFFASDLREGRFSLWNPYDKGGYPVFCDPQIDRYYPFNWPFAAWGALFGSSWWLIQIKVLAHHVAAASCMHLFLRSRGLSARAALVGGIGLVASAPLLVHKASIILWPLVWVPLIWMAIDALVAAPSWRRGAAAAAAFTLCATAASPPGQVYAMLLVVPYAIWRLLPFVWQRPPRRELIQLAIALVIAGVLAGLVLALTILPSRSLVELGSRDRFGAEGRELALALSLPLQAIRRGIFVRGAGLLEVYMGAAVFMLAVCAAFVRPRFDRGVALLWMLLALVGVALAAGSSSGVLPWLVDHVSVFGLLRVPGRYKLLSAWAIAAGAGFGIAALEAALGDIRLRRRAVAVVVVLGALAIKWLVTAANPASPVARPAWWSLPATLAPAALIVAAVWAPRRIAGFSLAALALVSLVDAPSFTHVPPNGLPAAEARQTHSQDAEWLARLPGVSDRWRVYDEFVLGERAGARLRIRDFRGYPALDPLSLHRYVDVLDFAKRDAAILTDFNVRWVLVRPHFRYGASASFARMGKPAREPAFVARAEGLWEAQTPAPLVQWVGAVDVMPRQRVLAAVRAIQDPDGIRRRAIVEPNLLPYVLGLVTPDAREGELTSYEPDEIRFTIEAPRDGLVVLNEIMFPGWHVDVDGRSAAPLVANYMLRAVRVGPGHHAVVWRFEPPRWRWYVAGYVLALVVMIAAALVPRRQSARAA